MDFIRELVLNIMPFKRLEPHDSFVLEELDKVDDYWKSKGKTFWHEQAEMLGDAYLKYYCDLAEDPKSLDFEKDLFPIGLNYLHNIIDAPDAARLYLASVFNLISRKTDFPYTKSIYLQPMKFLFPYVIGKSNQRAIVCTILPFYDSFAKHFIDFYRDQRTSIKLISDLERASDFELRTYLEIHGVDYKSYLGRPEFIHQAKEHLLDIERKKKIRVDAFKIREEIKKAEKMPEEGETNVNETSSKSSEKTKISKPPRHCFNCGTKEMFERYKKCGNCLSVRYCSRECQVQHWKREHKNECVKRQKPEKEILSFNM